MFYSEDFKKKVKSVYPEWTELHERLKCGDYFVGQLLEEKAQSTISIDEVLRAKSLEELQDKARTMLEKVELYRIWCDLYLYRDRDETKW